MNGLSRVVGIGPRVTVNGKEYQVRGKTNRFFAEVEAEILKLRGDPFDMIVDAGKRAKLDGDPELLNRVADVVAAKFRNWRVTTYGDYLEYMNSAGGDALSVYHCLRQDAPELTLEAVQDAIIHMQFRKASGDVQARDELTALFKAIAVASGEDALGNSTSRPPTTETPASQSAGS